MVIAHEFFGPAEIHTAIHFFQYAIPILGIAIAAKFLRSK